MTGDETAGSWNPTQLAIVREGPDAVVKYINANPSVRLELSWAHLVGANFGGVNLSGASLIGANLRHANLGDASLFGADLSRANLSCANLSCANLSEASLRGANLSYANLRGANLLGAGLDSADLGGANLRGANLDEASLGGANLTSADLREADLSGADLRGAGLRGANLVRAKLIEADFDGADLSLAELRATLVSTDLTKARGLDAVRHSGPSEVSHRVLLRPTARPWPIGFLRGCGLSDFEIEHARGIATTPIEFFSGFVSYSTKDDRFALKLHDALQAKGIRCWLDKHEILPGDNIYHKVNEGIRFWDKILLCASKHSIKSWWVKDELTRALEKEQNLEKERGHEVLAIVPLDLDGYLFDGECDDFEYASTLRKRHAARFSGWEGDEAIFDQQVERIAAAMRADALARPKPPTPKLGK